MLYPKAGRDTDTPSRNAIGFNDGGFGFEEPVVSAEGDILLLNPSGAVDGDVTSYGEAGGGGGVDIGKQIPRWSEESRPDG